MKVKFLGKSDKNFEHNCIYSLVKIDMIGKYFTVAIVNRENNIAIIPYSSEKTFNENWNIVEE